MSRVAFAWRPCGLLICALIIAWTATQAPAQERRLGTVEFPTSARSHDAQAHFVRGVAALHSFWYSVALEEFRAASRIEPDFAMAYWGEAMAHSHPVWGDSQDTEAARKVLAQLPAVSITSREQAYLDAVKALYGEGEKPARDRAYAGAMEKLHRDHPDDLEAAAFHALALLGMAYGGHAQSAGTAPHDGAPLRMRMQAGAIAQDIFRRAPNHPGAAHYILHAFDDPDHAVLALPAARRYADIAPSAPHALHMPSHIFLQLGMWPELVASNETSWHASLKENMPDFHSLHWLLYGLLQQGRDADAKALLATMRDSLAKVPEDNKRSQAYGAYQQATMAATYLVETARWNEAAEVLSSQREGAGPQQDSAHGSHEALAPLSQSPAVFARGLAAAMTGSGDAQGAVTALEEVRRKMAGGQRSFASNMAPVLEIQALEIAAAASATRGQTDEAIATARQAAQREAAMPVPPGPPPLIKPSHELLGEILLRAGRREEAAEAFATALFRHPGRAGSLKGAAQAGGDSLR
jgi:tetratricopeptide (TPR) repeat protein